MNRNWVEDQRGCWIWQGASSHGYGTVTVKGRTRYAHALMYEEAGYCLPDGKELDHTCRNTMCVNPDHLQAVTHAENNRRGRSTKLTKQQVATIRRMASRGVPQKAIAEKFGVDSSHISRIVRRRVWTADIGTRPPTANRRSTAVVLHEHNEVSESVRVQIPVSGVDGEFCTSGVSAALTSERQEQSTPKVVIGAEEISENFSFGSNLYKIENFTESSYSQAKVEDVLMVGAELPVESRPQVDSPGNSQSYAQVVEMSQDEVRG